MKKRLFGPCYFADGDLGGGVGGGDNTGNGGNDGNDFNFEEFKNTYGKDYAGKGFMQELDSPTKMFEKIDNLETLIGKKSFVPGEGATDKDWDDYRNRIGVQNKDVYNISTDNLPDNIKNYHAGDFGDKVKQIFYDAGLTPQQAKIINEKYDKLMIDTHGEMLNKIAEREKQLNISDEEFESLANQTWGNDRENVQKVAKALINAHTPDNIKPYLQNMSNKDLIIMASVLKGVSDKYISQDDLKSLKGEGAGSSESIRAEAQKELAKLASMSPFDKGYAEQQEKVNNLYANFK